MNIKDQIAENLKCHELSLKLFPIRSSRPDWNRSNTWITAAVKYNMTEHEKERPKTMYAGYPSANNFPRFTRTTTQRLLISEERISNERATREAKFSNHFAHEKIKIVQDVDLYKAQAISNAMARYDKETIASDMRRRDLIRSLDTCIVKDATYFKDALKSVKFKKGLVETSYNNVFSVEEDYELPSNLYEETAVNKQKQLRSKEKDVLDMITEFCEDYQLFFHRELVKPHVKAKETKKKEKDGTYYLRLNKWKREKVKNADKKKLDGVYNHDIVISLLRKQPHERSKIDKETLFRNFKNLKAFSKLSSFVLQELCAVFTLFELETDRAVFSQGDIGTCWYVILSGKVDVKISKTGNLEDSKKIATMEAGAGFGDLALISDKPRSATIVTIEPCMFAVIDKVDYNRILRFIHETECKEKAVFMKTLKDFGDWNVETLKSVVDVIKWKKFPAKTFILEEGKPLTEIFIVRNGTCRVIQNYAMQDRQFKIPVETCHEGEFFGEAVLTSDEQPISEFSIYAVTDVEMACVTAVDALSKFQVQKLKLRNHAEKNPSKLIERFREHVTLKKWDKYKTQFLKNEKEEKIKATDLRELPVYNYKYPPKSKKQSEGTPAAAATPANPATPTPNANTPTPAANSNAPTPAANANAQTPATTSNNQPANTVVTPVSTPKVEVPGPILGAPPPASNAPSVAAPVATNALPVAAPAVTNAPPVTAVVQPTTPSLVVTAPSPVPAVAVPSVVVSSNKTEPKPVPEPSSASNPSSSLSPAQEAASPRASNNQLHVIPVSILNTGSNEDKPKKLVRKVSIILHGE